MEQFQNQSRILHLKAFLQQTPNLFVLLDKSYLFQTVINLSSIDDESLCNSKDYKILFVIPKNTLPMIVYKQKKIMKISFHI